MWWWELQVLNVSFLLHFMTCHLLVIIQDLSCRRVLPAGVSDLSYKRPSSYIQTYFKHISRLEAYNSILLYSTHR